MSDTDRVVIKMALPERKPEPAASPELKPERRWSWGNWVLFILFVFAVHVALIFIFGEYRFPKTRPVANVPHLQLAGVAEDWVALDDPTLFVLPQARDFGRLREPEIKPSAFRWTEAPRWLPLSSENLGAVFNRFMQSNSFSSYELNFKPVPELSVPSASLTPAFAERSTLRLDDNLARRQLAEETKLPDLPYADVVKPATAQVTVNVDGNVVSAVLIESSGYKEADQRSLEVARAMRFKPSRHITVGQIIFGWHTVPPPPMIGQ